MKVDFTGKTVLVTGGAGGVGSVCVKQFLEAGAAVAAADLPGDALNALGGVLQKNSIMRGHSQAAI